MRMEMFIFGCSAFSWISSFPKIPSTEHLQWKPILMMKECAIIIPEVTLKESLENGLFCQPFYWIRYRQTPWNCFWCSWFWEFIILSSNSNWFCQYRGAFAHTLFCWSSMLFIERFRLKWDTLADFHIDNPFQSHFE